VKLGIPQVQEDLLEAVAALGKPVVLVLLNGSALSINWAKDHVPGIVELWYPGQAGGVALADVLFGDYNPGGRLPVTFYQSEEQLPAFDDYRMKGRTYRYFQGEPLFPFGYGLSYTTFAYTNVKIASASGEVTVLMDVKNTGKRDGDEVVQVYAKQIHPGSDAPIRSLVAFDRVHLKAGEQKGVELRFKRPAEESEIVVGTLTKRL
jgi:beta-glucosidase